MSDPPKEVPSVDEPSADGATMRTELPADLTSARQARSAIRQALAAWGMGHLSGDAELLASELIANAAEHGDGKPISLALRRHAEPGEQPASPVKSPTARRPCPGAPNPARAPSAAAVWRSSTRWPDPAACAPAKPARPPGSPSP
jgi:hypothetical protein